MREYLKKPLFDYIERWIEFRFMVEEVTMMLHDVPREYFIIHDDTRLN